MSLWGLNFLAIDLWSQLKASKDNLKKKTSEVGSKLETELILKIMRTLGEVFYILDQTFKK